jgi:hypothetical protein
MRGRGVHVDAIRHTNRVHRRAILVGGSALMVLVAGVWLVERAAEVRVIAAGFGSWHPPEPADHSATVA